MDCNFSRVRCSRRLMPPNHGNSHASSESDRASSLTSGQPPLWLLMAYIMSTFFCIGILFGNQNSLAMQPLGHLAGIGSAVVGSLSTLISMPIGTFIGQNYNGTIFPLVIGIAILSGISIWVVRWAESK